MPSLRRSVWTLLIPVVVMGLLISCGGGGAGGGGNSPQMGGAIQVELNLAGVVSTLAGVAPGSADGIGPAARFRNPYGVASDGINLYVADALNNTIRRVVIATAEVTTLAGMAGISGSADGTGSAARFNRPMSITLDGSDLYVADMYNQTIRKIDIGTGAVTTLAGTAASSGSADGTGAAARFNFPRAITTDGISLYVADSYNHTIRRIVITTAAVTTLAGTAGANGTADGTGAAARFYYPGGILTDGTNVYVADTYNCSIRQIVIASAAVTTLAGTSGMGGSSDGIGSAAGFYSPLGLATDGTNLYVSDSGMGTMRKIVIATAAVTTLAGSPGQHSYADGIGSAARFYLPVGVAVVSGNLYVADSENQTIRKIVIATREVTTLAGTKSLGSADGTGAAASFNYPAGITTDGTNLYVADAMNWTIRKIVIATGEVTTLAGLAGWYGSADGTGTAARFFSPYGITTDGANLYVADSGNSTIRKIVIATGAVTTLAGTTFSYGSADGTGAAARFDSPMSITTDGTNLYVADSYNHTIRKIVIATAEVTTLAGAAGMAGSADGIGANARFYYPRGITTDGFYLYVSDTNNSTIRQIIISSGEVMTLAGTAGMAGSTDGFGAVARFSFPAGITADGNNLYVAEASTIRKIVKVTGEVTTLAGTAGTFGSTDGSGTAASFYNPFCATTDGISLYIADQSNNTIRKIQ